MTDKPWKRPPPEVKQEFSEEEIASVVGELSEDDIRKASETLNDAQEKWEDLAFISTEKIPCRECGNRGTIPMGAFGDVECPSCRGQRVVEHPGNDKFDMPDFVNMRAAITAYGNALIDRKLPSGHPGKRGLALPAASTVPTLESLQAMVKDAQDKAKAHKALGAGGNVQQLLKDAPQRKRRSDDDDDGGDFTDADLDQIEEDDRG